MEELRLPLLILGIFAIVAVTAHGLWTIRKNAIRKATRAAALNAVRESNERSAKAHQDDDEGFDELGVGPVRVVSDSARTEPKLAPEPPVTPEQPAQPQVDKEPKPDLSAVKAPNAPDWMAEDVPEPPSSLLRPQNADDNPASDDAGNERKEPVLTAKSDEPEPVQEPQSKPSLADKARKLVSREKPTRAKARREPKVAEDQMIIDFDDEVDAGQQKSQTVTPTQPQSQPQSEVSADAEQQVLVLNVKMPDEQSMSGASLLPVLLTLGFKFGAQDIFHRHVNSNGKGPVLFSLANMFKPGIFDVDNMENFTTRGVSLFMILPIEGDPHQVFNMMHNAAKKIADEFGAQILDGRRSVLTKQGLQQYSEKIRESERRRMLKR